MNRRMLSIPEENVYSAATYRDTLSGLGFTDVSIESIADYVFSGSVRYRGMLAAGGASSAAVTLTERDFAAEQWFSQWHDGLGLGDYVVVTAAKPLE